CFEYDLTEGILHTKIPLHMPCSGAPVTVKELAEQIADEYGRRDLLLFGGGPIIWSIHRPSSASDSSIRRKVYRSSRTACTTPKRRQKRAQSGMRNWSKISTRPRLRP